MAPDAPTVTADRMRRQIDQTGEHARGDVDGAERQSPDEALEHRAKLRQNGEVDDQMKHPGVNERRRQQTPPLAVRRAGSEAGAHADERVRIADRARAKQHGREHRRAERDQRRRDEQITCPRTKRVTECIRTRGAAARAATRSCRTKSTATPRYRARSAGDVSLNARPPKTASRSRKFTSGDRQDVCQTRAIRLHFLNVVPTESAASGDVSGRRTAVHVSGAAFLRT